MDNVFRCGLLAPVVRIAPVVVVPLEYNLVGRECLQVVRAGNDRHGIVLEFHDLREIVGLAIARGGDDGFENRLRQDGCLRNRIQDYERVPVVACEIEDDIVVSVGLDRGKVLPVSMTRGRKNRIDVEREYDIFNGHRSAVVPLGLFVKMNRDAGIRLGERIRKHGFEFVSNLIICYKSLIHQADISVDGKIRVVIQRVKRRRRSPIETTNIESLGTRVFGVVGDVFFRRFVFASNEHPRSKDQRES